MKWFASLGQRDLRALLALIFSILGAIALTGFAAWLVYILWHGGWPHGTESDRIDALAKALFGTLFIVGIVLISLGLAINRRSIKATGPLGLSVDASGGEDPDPSAVVAAAAQGAAQGAVTGAAAQQ